MTFNVCHDLVCKAFSLLHHKLHIQAIKFKTTSWVITLSDEINAAAQLFEISIAKGSCHKVWRAESTSSKMTAFEIYLQFKVHKILLLVIAKMINNNSHYDAPAAGISAVIGAYSMP